MRFAIDIVGVDRNGVVVKIRANVPRSRIVIALKAFAIVELPAGSVATTNLKLGDHLIVCPPTL